MISAFARSTTEDFPSVITLARDLSLLQCPVTQHREIPPEIQASEEKVMSNIILWTGKGWQLAHDALATVCEVQQDIPERLHVSTAHLYSDAIIFLARTVETAVLMYLQWLESCDKSLLREVVKPNAAVIVFDDGPVDREAFFRRCSMRADQGLCDDIEFRKRLFRCVDISAAPASAPLEAITTRGRTGTSLSWQPVQEAYIACRRRREDAGRVWSHENLMRLYVSWCMKLTPPDAVELLTSKLPAMALHGRRTIPGRRLASCKKEDSITSPGTPCLQALFKPGLDQAEIRKHAIPVLASVLALHSTSSLHWSDKPSFMNQHFSLRYSGLVNGLLSASDSQPAIGMHIDEKRDAMSTIDTRQDTSLARVARAHAAVQTAWERRMGMFVSSSLGNRVQLVRLHIMTLRRHRNYLSKQPYGGACATCILNPWAVLLLCEHGLCNLCLRAVGSEISGGAQVSLKNCPVCDFALPDPYHVSFEPPTAVARVLALDGGGVRGIVQLETLQMLEERLGLDAPLTVFFDLMVGTSIGGICALGLGKCGWSVKDCKQKFLELTERVFSSVSMPEKCMAWATNGWYKTLRDALKILLTDSLYNTNVIEEVLQQAFGPERKMVSGRVLCREPRVAVVVDEATTSTCQILPTYNTCGHPNVRQYRWPARCGEFRVWEAARCTSAAPSYWHPKELFDETYQDGALDWNNPTPIALQEVKNIYPNRSRNQVTISLGTGRTRTSLLPGKSLVRRLCNSFSSKIDAEKQYEDILLLAGRENLNLRRLNPTLDTDEVRLNDWSSIPRLQNAIRRALAQDTQVLLEVDKITQILLASLFYFEIRDYKRVKGSAALKTLPGLVMSRLTNTEMQSFNERYPHAKIQVNGVHFDVTMPLYVNVSYTDERKPFQINLVLGKCVLPINGSPFTITQLRTALQDFLPLTNIFNRKRKLMR